MGNDVTLVNPAYETAIELRDLLQKYGLSCDEENTGEKNTSSLLVIRQRNLRAFHLHSFPNDVKETRKVRY